MSIESSDHLSVLIKKEPENNFCYSCENLFKSSEELNEHECSCTKEIDNNYMNFYFEDNNLKIEEFVKVEGNWY